jgi:hypothetical protein
MQRDFYDTDEAAVMAAAYREYSGGGTGGNRDINEIGGRESGNRDTNIIGGGEGGNIDINEIGSGGNGGESGDRDTGQTYGRENNGNRHTRQTDAVAEFIMLALVTSALLIR